MESLNRQSLWRFALDVYPRAKTELLHWQDNYGLHVNDLLLLAFARRRDTGIDLETWYRIERSRPRRLLRRVRRLRYGYERDDPRRKTALDWELLLERIDLALLAECLHSTGKDSRDGARRMARYWRLEEVRVRAWLERIATLAEG